MWYLLHLETMDVLILWLTFVLLEVDMDASVAQVDLKSDGTILVNAGPSPSCRQASKRGAGAHRTLSGRVRAKWKVPMPERKNSPLVISADLESISL
jgi:hypothetical protein